MQLGSFHPIRIGALNRQQDTRLQELMEESNKYAQAHDLASQRYRRLSSAMGLPLIGVNAVLSVINGNETLPPVLVSSLLVLNAVVVGVKELLQIDKRSQFHAFMSSEYIKHARDIERLSLRGSEAPTPLEEFSALHARSTHLNSRCDFSIPSKFLKQQEAPHV